MKRLSIQHRNLIILVMLLLSPPLFGQNRIEIGRAIDNQYAISADTTILKKSLQITLADGTQIHQLHIDSEGKNHYLVGTGIYKGYKKIIAVTLNYDIMTRTWYAEKGNGHVTCASAACKDCKLFKENGQVIGCHCTDLGTVSNQCNFTKKELSLFYSNYTRLVTQQNQLLKK